METVASLESLLPRSNYSPERYAEQFEQLTLSLVARRAEEQGKRFQRYYENGPLELQGYAPEGLDEMPGPLWLEIRPLTRFEEESVLANLRSLQQVAQKSGFRSVLFVTSESGQGGVRNLLSELTTPDLELYIWGAEELTSFIQQYAEYLTYLTPRVIDVAVDNVVSKSLTSDPGEWIETRSRFLDQLRASYAEDDLVLFLGAGVSKSSGIPDWNALLYRLFVSMVDAKLSDVDINADEKQLLAEALQESQDFSPLLEARYIRAGLGDKFGELVSTFLYDTIQESGIASSPLLRSLARLCMPRRDGPGVKAVVTFNFDDLFEQALTEAGIRHRSIFRDEDIAGRGQLGIFHVHGFTPRDKKLYEGLSSSPLVFSEEEYHTLTFDPYLWSNIVQLNFLRDSRCLLIGLSVNDPNLRRLLDIAARKNKNPKHFVVMERIRADDFLKHVKGRNRRVRSDIVEKFLAIHHSLQETSFRQLNLNVIWVESHSEIPELIIDRIRK
ncbi:MAG: SIR2 family protein [Gemmatimonadota bacterium]|nr:SIR2 family protein [Gemmatimonadota bacterium]